MHQSGMDPGAVGGPAEHDSEGIPARDVADGEGRIVGPHRPGPDQDGVALGPQPMDVQPGPRAR